MPFPWERLPDELKLEILKYWLLGSTIAVNDRKHEIRALMLTSAHMRGLALEFWRKNLFIMCFSQRLTGPISAGFSLVGQHCRILRVQLNGPGVLSCNRFAVPGPSENELNVWLHLLSPAKQPASNKIAWQLELPNLRHLTVVIKMKHMPNQFHFKDAPCFGGQDAEQFLEDSRCHLRADHVRVDIRGIWSNYTTTVDPAGSTVEGLATVRHCPHRCVEKLAMGLKAFLVRKLSGIL